MRQRQKLVLGALVLAVLVGGAFFYLRNSEIQQTERPRLREAPAFELKDRSGQIHRLKDYQGKLVVLHFWASWCAPCLDEIPKFAEFAATLKDQPIQFVAISLDDRWEDAEKILPPSKLGPQLASVLDVGQKVSDRYGSYQFPESYLITPRQEILLKWVGAQDWTGKTMHEVFERAIQGLANRR